MTELILKELEIHQKKECIFRIDYLNGRVIKLITMQ